MEEVEVLRCCLVGSVLGRNPWVHAPGRGFRAAREGVFLVSCLLLVSKSLNLMACVLSWTCVSCARSLDLPRGLEEPGGG